MKEADTALRPYDYFLARERRKGRHDRDEKVKAWQYVEEKLHQVLRLHHRSLSPGRTYLRWVRRFKNFLVRSNRPHLLEKGYDIRTMQQLLLQTTMIYTHVAERNILGVKSPFGLLTISPFSYFSLKTSLMGQPVKPKELRRRFIR